MEPKSPCQSDLKLKSYVESWTNSPIKATVASPTIFTENGEQTFMWNVKISMNTADVSLQNREHVKDRLNMTFQQIQQNGKQKGFEVHALKESNPMILCSVLATIDATEATDLAAVTAKEYYGYSNKEQS